MKTIYDDDRYTHEALLQRVEAENRPCFAAYDEYRKLVEEFWRDRLAEYEDASSKRFNDIYEGYQRIDGKIAPWRIDEYNKADQLADLAGQHRQIGLIRKAVGSLIWAERYASRARYSAPLVWCKLAVTYASIPLEMEAKRCIDNAHHVMSLADTSDNAILPGDTTGRWIPELGMDYYVNEIRKSETMVAGLSVRPMLHPSATLELLRVEDESSRKTFSARATSLKICT